MTATVVVAAIDLRADGDLLARNADRLTAADQAELPTPVGDDVAGASASQQARRAVRIVLRLALAGAAPEFAEAPIARRQSGQPYIAGHSGAISMAHSARWVAVAISPRGPVGVDIEADRPRDWPPDRARRLIESVASLNARTWLDARGDKLADVARPPTLIEAWTVAEAVAKARGDGIGATLADIGVFARAGGSATSDQLSGALSLQNALPSADSAIQSWHRAYEIRQFSLPGCVGAVATARGGACERWSVERLLATGGSRQ